MRQIKILGAGISGLTAAINLAKAGYDVKIFEKNRDAGVSHKLDFEGLENWTCDIIKTIKNVNIKTNFKNKPFYECTWHSPFFRKAEIKSKEPFFYLVERGGKDSIEYSLKKQAIDYGVEFEFNTKKTAEEGDIIATGAKTPEGVAFGTFFENVKHDDCCIGIFSNDVSPHGYFYLHVWDGRACVVTLAYKKKIDIRALHEKNHKIDVVKDIIRNSKKMHDFGGFANFRVPFSAMDRGKILTGEAAGFQECFMGFGMKYAFLSGYFAAKSIIENISYDSLWKESFLDEMKKSHCNRLFVNLFGEGLYEKAISYMQKNSDCRGALKKIYCSYNWKYKMLYGISKIIN